MALGMRTGQIVPDGSSMIENAGNLVWGIVGP